MKILGIVITSFLLIGCQATFAAGIVTDALRDDPGRSDHSLVQDEKDPVFVYRAVPIGTTAEEVRKKLGDPKDKSDAQDLYIFSDDESAQFIYDGDKKVRAIMITFTGKLGEAPTPKQVFGVDAEAKPDGGIFKMVRYTKAGFWISYNKIVGDDSIISIAMQKI
ncbi:MAG: hypothetical protein IPM25_00535 [Chloracidobacterium sp.]|nr:hypothetical protein [Chloracidobacterium sp.]